jgi:serine/threonine protein kinase
MQQLRFFAFQDYLPEINIMKNVNHPNIVKFYGAWMKKKEIFVRCFAMRSIFGSHMR